MGRKPVDHSGETINGIKLNKRIEDYIPPGGSRPMARYNCTCFCGNIFDTMYQSIQHGTSCGCRNLAQIRSKHPDRVRNIIGERFGYCVAEKRMDDGKWLCLCDCGNYFTTSLSHLTTGHTKSCGCYRSECSIKRFRKDITGQTNGELTAIKYLRTEHRSDFIYLSVWLFRCSCGNYVEMPAAYFASGDVKSCGCVGSSYREQLIYKWLKSKGVSFKTEFKFNDLRYKHLLRFDFAIFNKNNELLCLIEHQGRQHFEEFSKGTKWGTEQREITDKIKKEYCKRNKIKLFEILFSDDYEERLTNILAELHVDTVPSLQETA